MSLKSWFIRREIKGAIEDAESGKDGPEAKEAMDWIKSHKTVVSAVFAGITAAAHFTGYGDAVTGILAVVSGVLFGGGALESDAAHKEGRAS